MDAEFLIQLFNQGISPLDLVFSGRRAFAVGNDADAYGLGWAAPGPAGRDGPLPLPVLRGKDLAVASAGAVADDEVTIEVLGFG